MREKQFPFRHDESEMRTRCPQMSGSQAKMEVSVAGELTGQRSRSKGNCIWIGELCQRSGQRERRAGLSDHSEGRMEKGDWFQSESRFILDIRKKLFTER